MRSQALALSMTLTLAACGGGQHAQHEGANGSSGGTTHADASASPMDAASASDAEANGASAEADSGFIPPTGSQAQQVAPLYAQGMQAYRAGDFPSAAQAFRHAYEIYPNPGTAYNAARAYERMGEVNDAIHFFDIVRASHPDAALQADIDHRVAALQAYDQRRRTGIAQSLPSQDALSQEGNTWFQRGVALYRRHEYSQALIAFEQAYQYLQTPELYFNLAVTHEHLHNIDRALEFMREYLEARRGTAEEAFIEQRIHELESHR